MDLSLDRARFLFFLPILILSFNAGAQSNYQQVANRFMHFYNMEQGDSIFNMFAPIAKEKMPLEKTRSLMEGLHVQYGDLKSLNLLQQDTGYARFKAIFKDQILALVLALDRETQIEGLRLLPLKQEPSDSNNVQNLREH
jgi:hypothetical protein